MSQVRVCRGSHSLQAAVSMARAGHATGVLQVQTDVPFWGLTAGKTTE